MNYMKQEFKMTLKLERKKRQWKILLFEIIQLSFYYIIFFWVSCLSYVCIVRRVSDHAALIAFFIVIYITGFQKVEFYQALF